MVVGGNVLSRILLLNMNEKHITLIVSNRQIVSIRKTSKGQSPDTKIKEKQEYWGEKNRVKVLTELCLMHPTSGLFS